MEVNGSTQSVQQAAKVLHSLFPDLKMNHISLLSEGWDSVAFLVADTIVFRLPKRPDVARQLAKEIRVLEAIRPYVSVRIPFIEWVGQPQGDCPVSAIGYRKLPGMPLAAIPPGVAKDNALRQVGQFLTDLHAIPTSVLKGADVPWFRWTGDNSVDGPDGWEAGLRTFTDRIIEEAVPLLDSSMAMRVTSEIAAFLAEPQHFDFQPVLIHGDLSAEHILVDTDGGEIGVIDFGDCGMGDPAYDVGAEVLPWYGGHVDASFQSRQQFYRRLAPFHGVLHGLATGDERLVTGGLREVVTEFGCQT